MNVVKNMYSDIENSDADYVEYESEIEYETVPSQTIIVKKSHKNGGKPEKSVVIDKIKPNEEPKIVQINNHPTTSSSTEIEPEYIETIIHTNKFSKRIHKNSSNDGYTITYFIGPETNLSTIDGWKVSSICDRFIDIMMGECKTLHKFPLPKDFCEFTMENTTVKHDSKIGAFVVTVKRKTDVILGIKEWVREQSIPENGKMLFKHNYAKIPNKSHSISKNRKSFNIYAVSRFSGFDCSYNCGDFYREIEQINYLPYCMIEIVFKSKEPVVAKVISNNTSEVEQPIGKRRGRPPKSYMEFTDNEEVEPDNVPKKVVKRNNDSPVSNVVCHQPVKSNQKAVISNGVASLTPNGVALLTPNGVASLTPNGVASLTDDENFTIIDNRNKSKTIEFSFTINSDMNLGFREKFVWVKTNNGYKVNAKLNYFENGKKVTDCEIDVIKNNICIYLYTNDNGIKVHDYYVSIKMHDSIPCKNYNIVGSYNCNEHSIEFTMSE